MLLIVKSDINGKIFHITLYLIRVIRLTSMM